MEDASMPIPGLGDSSNQMPILKYNAKAGRFKVDGETLSEISFLADLDHMQAGWARFGENAPPGFFMLPIADLAGGEPFPEQPEGSSWKKGVRLMVKLSDRSANGRAPVRELASNSFVVRRSFNDLYDAWDAERARHPGCLPVVSCRRCDEIEGRCGSNYAPVFEITDWIRRPPDLNGQSLALVQIPKESPEPPRQNDDYSDLDDEIPFGWAAGLIVPWTLALLGMGGVA
jgi:hypothetical protein